MAFTTLLQLYLGHEVNTLREMDATLAGQKGNETVTLLKVDGNRQASLGILACKMAGLI
jgi:exopolysaccharide biosynthesis protein